MHFVIQQERGALPFPSQGSEWGKEGVSRDKNEKSRKEGRGIVNVLLFKACRTTDEIGSKERKNFAPDFALGTGR